MRAYELIKETFLRRAYVWVIHLVWLALYLFYWWLFLPNADTLGGFVFTWGGFLLPLALSAGIFGDDIASGRICVLITKPFWWGRLYIFRLLGLSLQGAVHFLLCACLVLVLQLVTRKIYVSEVALWLLGSWLMFNTVAALSTTLSVVVGRAFNSLLILVVVIAGTLIINMLMFQMQGRSEPPAWYHLIRYACPPFELLKKFAAGERGEFSLFFGRFSVAKNMAIAIHSLILTMTYGLIGILLLCRREFSRVRD
jgi:hypothetical protein